MSDRMQSLAGAFLIVGTLLLGCTEATPNYCQKNGDCTGGRVCDVTRAICVSPDAATMPIDGAQALDGAIDTPSGRDVGLGDIGLVEVLLAADATHAGDVALAIDAPTPIDVAERDTPLSVDTRTVDVIGPDVYVPDGAGTCGSNRDCTDPAKAFCVGNVCVGCQPDVDAGVDAGANACVAPTAVCDTLSGKCVGCTVDSHCSSATSPICSKTTNTCVACTASQCAGLGDPSRGACASTGACVQCTANTNCSGTTPVCETGSNKCVQCTANTDCSGATPVCDTASNKCVQCLANTQCSGTTPICAASKTCTGCSASSPCAPLSDPARAVCATSGACVECTGNAQCSGATPVCNTATNKCVQCLASTSCSGTTPVCATTTNTCRGCTAASDCVTLGIAGHLACGSSGACVQCTDNTTCSGTTPICATATNTCRSCAADGECAAIGPGVCMSQSDGHCATDAETIYVGTFGAGTCNESNAGTAQAPVCSAQTGVGLAKSGSKPVVVIGGTLGSASTTIAVSAPLTIVGKNMAVLTPAATGADAIDITSGVVYLRGLTVRGGALTGIGINATPGTGSSVTVHMDTCVVVNNPGGGILLNSAAFDIKNTTVTGNGPGTAPVSGATYGGVRIDALPASGPSALNLLTIQNNKQVGLSCPGSGAGAGPIAGVLASGNSGGDIGPTCGFTSCGSDGGATCGAQSTP
jgi:hypothetical protein